MRKVLSIGVALGTAAAVAALLACSSESAAPPAGSRCTPGATVTCPCSGGGSGVQTCQADGTFAACSCVSDSGQPSDSLPGQETGSDSGPVTDTGTVADSGTDSGPFSGVACVKTDAGILTCPGGTTGNNCCYRKGAPSLSTCAATCATDEWQFACDGPEDCPSGTVCCANLQSNGFPPTDSMFGWIANKSYCKPASLGCNVDMSRSASAPTAMPCHTSADCPSTFPKCCHYNYFFTPVGNPHDGQRSCVTSEDIPTEGIVVKCYDPTF